MFFKDRYLENLAVGAVAVVVAILALGAVSARALRQVRIEAVPAAVPPAEPVAVVEATPRPTKAQPDAAAGLEATPAPSLPPEASPTPASPTQAPTAAPETHAGVQSLTPAIIRPTSINGVPFESFVVIDDAVVRRIHEVFVAGQALGNNPRAFSKVGDSTIESPYFMGWFDIPGRYNLGDYDYLQPAIDYYAGSFRHTSMAVARGMRAASALSPLWSDKSVCGANESPIACELRIFRPSVMFVRLGSNEASPETFDRYLRELVEYCIAKGVIPILGTKADRREGPENSMNTVVKQVAHDYAVPLWDFDLLAQTIPGGGVGRDGVHLTSFFSHDFREALAYETGYGVHNLSGLVALDTVWHALHTDPDGPRRTK